MSKKGSKGKEPEETDDSGPVVIPPEMMAAMCEWRFAATGEDVLGTLPKPITYLLTADGVRVVRKTALGLIVEELEGEPLIPLPLQPLAAGLRPNVPKIPWEHFRSTVAFFRHVAVEMKDECLVRFYYDRALNEWTLKVPLQEVSGAGVEVDEKWKFDEQGALVHVADIHSHVQMNAFFSSVDDKDEKRAVRLYGVVGRVSDPQPLSKWRMWTGFNFLDLSISDVVEIPSLRIAGPSRSIAELLSCEGDAKKVTADLSTIDPFAGATFPKEWLTMVSEWKPTLGPMSDHERAMWSTESPLGYMWTRALSVDDLGDDWEDERPVITPSRALSVVSGNGHQGHFFNPDGAYKPGRWATLENAKVVAAQHTAKDVYILNGDIYSRVRPDGNVVATTLTHKDISKRKRRGKVGSIEVFDLTPADLGRRQ